MKPVTDKQFCPYCKLELDGAGHKYETQAWDLYNCEYNRTNSEKDPIPEYEINLSEIEKLKEERALAFQSIKELKTRNEQIKLAKSA
tara:strand:+ start:718 stop:978 length:261 start_codon:yes stop_codon:yes gene_type:complete